MVETFAQLVKSARKRLGVSQEELAQKVHQRLKQDKARGASSYAIKQTTVSGWEHGRVPELGEQEVRALADVLELSESDVARAIADAQQKTDRYRNSMNTDALLDVQEAWFDDNRDLLPHATMTVVSPAGLALRSKERVQNSWATRCAAGLNVRVLWIDELMPLEEEGLFQLKAAFQAVGEQVRAKGSDPEIARTRKPLRHYFLEAPPDCRLGESSERRRRLAKEFLHELEGTDGEANAPYWGQSGHIIPLRSEDRDLLPKLLMFHNPFGVEVVYEMPGQSQVFCLGVEDPRFIFPSIDAPDREGVASLRVLSCPPADNRWASEFRMTLSHVMGGLALDSGLYALALTTADNDLQRRLFDSGSWLIKAALASNPALGHQWMEVLASPSELPEVRRCVASNPKIASSVVDVLSRDPHPEVKLALLESVSMTDAALRTLRDDGHAQVRSRALVRSVGVSSTDKRNKSSKR